MIRQQVEQHEKAVIEKAKRLEKARLKEQEAERLRQEAKKNIKLLKKMENDAAFFVYLHLIEKR